MKKFGIIGAGFSGTMTAVQLIDKSTEPCEIILINKRETLNKGIAYNPYSDKHLLNSNLKGELWESTAVNELRGQAEKLAERLKARQLTALTN